MNTPQYPAAITESLGWYIQAGASIRRLVQVDMENQEPLPLPHQNIPTDADGLVEVGGHLAIPHVSVRLHLN